MSNMESLTPLVPKPQHKAMTMSFFDALKVVQAGKWVARISWANKDYCLMKDTWLSIYTKGKFHTWLINDGDMEGRDYIIVTRLN